MLRRSFVQSVCACFGLPFIDTAEARLENNKGVKVPETKPSISLEEIVRRAIGVANQCHSPKLGTVHLLKAISLEKALNDICSYRCSTKADRDVVFLALMWSGIKAMEALGPPMYFSGEPPLNRRDIPFTNAAKDVVDTARAGKYSPALNLLNALCENQSGDATVFLWHHGVSSWPRGTRSIRQAYQPKYVEDSELRIAVEHYPWCRDKSRYPYWADRFPDGDE